jgi:hypothetical protein
MMPTNPYQPPGTEKSREDRTPARMLTKVAWVVVAICIFAIALMALYLKLQYLDT